MTPRCVHGVPTDSHCETCTNEPATGQISPKTQVEGSRATNPPSAPAAGPCVQCGEYLSHCQRFDCPRKPAPAAGPDAQTPSETQSTDALYASIDGKLPSIQFGEMFAHARQLERANADLQRRLHEFEITDQVSTNFGLQQENADLRRQIDLDTATITRMQEAAYRDEATIDDLRRQLVEWQGVARRNDPVMYEKWEESERQLAAERSIPRACRALEQDEVGAPCSYLQDAEAALATERAAREVAIKDYQLRLERVEFDLKEAERERAAAADLAKEECAKICDMQAALWDKLVSEGGPLPEVNRPAWLRECAMQIRATIADPAAVKRTLEDAARLIAYFTLRGERRQPLVEMELREINGETVSLDEWRAAIDAALKGEERK